MYFTCSIPFNFNEEGMMNIPKGTKVSYVKKMIKAAKKTLQEYKNGTHDPTYCAFCFVVRECSKCCYWHWFYRMD